MITTLSQYADDLVLWQSECIGIWRQMVEAMVELSRVHTSQQVTVQQQYPELFEYVAKQPDTVLMPMKLSSAQKISGTPSQHVRCL